MTPGLAPPFPPSSSSQGREPGWCWPVTSAAPRANAGRNYRWDRPAPVSLNKLYDTTTLTPLPELVEQYRKFARIFRDDFGLDHPTWQEA